MSDIKILSDYIKALKLASINVPPVVAAAMDRLEKLPDHWTAMIDVSPAHVTTIAKTIAIDEKHLMDFGARLGL